MADIKMNFELMQDTITAFLQAANELDDVNSRLQNAAQRLEDGALVGQAGDELVDAIRGPLKNKFRELGEKFEETAKDLQAAMDAMEAAEDDARGEF